MQRFQVDFRAAHRLAGGDHPQRRRCQGANAEREQRFLSVVKLGKEIPTPGQSQEEHRPGDLVFYDVIGRTPRTAVRFAFDAESLSQQRLPGEIALEPPIIARKIAQGEFDLIPVFEGWVGIGTYVLGG